MNVDKILVVTCAFLAAAAVLSAAAAVAAVCISASQ